MCPCTHAWTVARRDLALQQLYREHLIYGGAADSSRGFHAAAGDRKKPGLAGIRGSRASRAREISIEIATSASCIYTQAAVVEVLLLRCIGSQEKGERISILSLHAVQLMSVARLCRFVHII